jgi:predicted dehydrogenase
MERVEAVSIAVPTSAHHAVAKAALQKGVHVLVEKPITVTQPEAIELIELAEQRECILQVGHIERFNPAIAAVRPHIGAPSFVECSRVSSFGTRGTDVDVVRDLMIHDLDMILSFDLGAVEDVQAAGVRVLSSTIDAANARITFQNGCMANLNASRISLNPQRELKLYYPDSCIVVDYRARQATIQRRTAQGNGSPVISIDSPVEAAEEPLKLELQSFVQCISTGAPPLVTGRDGLAALELADKVVNAIGAFMQQRGSSSPSQAVLM